VIAALVALGAAAVTAATISGGAAVASGCRLSALDPVPIRENSFVYAADGTLLGSIPAEENRQSVPLSRVSPWMQKATIAIEDRRFYRHGGIDVAGIARALWADLRAGRVEQGGSTITQQLVRNLYDQRERTLERKLREACLAVKLDRAWSKDRILTGYMNAVYYGNHAYGIEAAAQTYFSRRARSLTLKQAALLAGLPQAPSVYDPFRRPDQARTRRNQVLRSMLVARMITRAQYVQASADEDLQLRPGKLYTRIREPYFFGYVREELIAEYGAETVRSGGLRVYTTIDPRLQHAARKAITSTLYYKDDPAAAVVTINPATGAIKAMTAVTPGKRGNQFNLAAQARRQAGSTFKTFVLTAAIAEGANPDTTYYVSAPLFYRPDPSGRCEDGSAWCVETYDESYVGSTSVANATLRSDNTVFAQLTLDLGPEKVAAMANRLGIKSSLKTKDGDYVPSLGLGSMGVSPLEMASAYATFAAGGIYSRPMAIRRVVFANGAEDTDVGWGEPERHRVIPDWVAAEVTEILEENIQDGTGTAAQLARRAAGKTGTTDRHTDAWFCGYTPNLSTTVWVGYPRRQISMENVHGIRVAGGTFPAQIWRLFMEVALEDAPVLDWPEPQTEPVWRPFDQGQYALSSGYSSGYSGSYSPPPPSASPQPQAGPTTPDAALERVERAPPILLPPPAPPAPEPAPTP
jgi:penicillin-binding protein 1A